MIDDDENKVNHSNIFEQFQFCHEMTYFMSGGRVGRKTLNNCLKEINRRLWHFTLRYGMLIYYREYLAMTNKYNSVLGNQVGNEVEIKDLV